MELALKTEEQINAAIAVMEADCSLDLLREVDTDDELQT
jgi:hypothetical protein